MNPSLRNILALIVGTTLLIFLAIFVFTSPAIIASFQLIETGQIGDTIGGISAPVIGILGAVLVYLSFYQQLIANRNQVNATNAEILRTRQSKDFSILLELFSRVKEDLDNLAFSSQYSKKRGEPRGRSAIYVFTETFEKFGKKEFLVKNGFCKDYLYVLAEINLLLDKLDTSSVTDDDKKLVFTLINNLYRTKMQIYSKRIVLASKKHQIAIKFSKYLNKIDTRVSSMENDIELELEQ